MANLLESIGRSNTLSSTTKDVSGFLTNLEELKQAKTEAPYRMGLLQNQIAASQQQLEINKFNLGKAQDEQREFNKHMPVEMFRPMFQYPEQYEHALNVARMNGLVNSNDPDDIHIIYGKLPEVGKLLGNEENRVSMATLGKNAAVRQKNALAQQIMEYENQAGGKDLSTDKKYMELTGAYQKAVEGYQNATNTYDMVTAEQQYKQAQTKNLLTGGDREYTQTATVISPKDNKAHVMGWNPQTDKYDVDMGLAPSSAEKTTRDAYKENAVLTRIVDKFNADPNVRRTGSMENFATIIVDASESDNPIAHASLETLMARASGEVGNLSEADKKPFGGSRALTAKFNQYLSEIYSGRKTPENLQFIRELANTFMESGRKQKEKVARERAKQYAAANPKMFTAEEIFNALSPDSGDYRGAETTLHQTLPQGAKLIGTSNGKKVYQTPDGKKFLEE